METRIEEVGPFERVLTVRLGDDDLEQHKDQAARKLGRDLKVKGFRPGRVPRRIVEAQVGAEALRNEAIELALPAIVAEALVEAEVAPATSPRIREMRDVDDGVEVDVAVALWPTLEKVPVYGGRKITVTAPELDESDIDEQVERLRLQFAELEDVSRPAVDGDYVLIDVSATRHGQRVEDISSSDLLYEVGSNTYLPGLDDQLGGTGAGDILKFNAELPEGYGEMTGAEVTLQVLVKGVKARRLPELTDEWAAEVSEFDTLAELRAEVAAGLADSKQAAVRSEHRSLALNAVLEELDLEIPEALVQAEVEARVHDLAHRLESQGVDAQQFFSGLDDSFLDQLRTESERSLKSRILLDAIAAEEELTVADGELEPAVAALAAQAGTSPEEFRSAIEGDGRVELLTGDILRRKALDHLVGATVPVDAGGRELDLEPPAEEPDDEPDDETAAAAGSEPAAAETSTTTPDADDGPEPEE